MPRDYDSLRVTPATKSLVETWIEDRRRLTGRRPTHDQFVLELLRAASSATAQPTASPPPRHAEWHRLLDIILDHGTPRDVTGIQANLEWGATAVERSTPPLAGQRAKRMAG